MRGLYSSKTEIRHKIFTEIARMAYEGQSPEMLEELPYKIVPGEIATYRDSIFLERAVVGERLRVAMGMSLRKVTEHAPISKGVEASVIEEKYYEPPLINVIKFACNSCPEKRVMITEGCQGCLQYMVLCPQSLHSLRMVLFRLPSISESGTVPYSGKLYKGPAPVLWKCLPF